MKALQTDSPLPQRTYSSSLASPPRPPLPPPPASRESVFAAPKHKAVLTTQAPRRMSITLKRRFPFCSSPLSSSHTPDCSAPAHEKASPPALLDSEDVAMSGCQPVANPFHSLPHTKAALPGMTGGSISSSTGPILHSISTSASSSNNSSPTTTISTAESTSTESDTLASSDPNSPTTSLLPLASPDDLSIVPPTVTAGSSPQSVSPSKKPRNTKNLSLNVPPPVGIPRAQPTGIDPSMQGISPRSMSAPSSPAFILPPPPPAPKRKPSNLGLTIKLPSTLGQGTGMKAVGGNGLRHHQSSPSLFSPGPGGVPGGMRFPGPSMSSMGQPRTMHPPRQFSYEAPSSITPSASPPRTPPAPLHEMDEEDEPRSGEAKSPAYPAGPVCIFDPHVFLFAEPDADLACQFDVVINVAREVLNPLAERDRKNRERRPSRPLSMIPDTACTDASFSTAMEEAMFSPAPREEKRPEYIHMPWDHNTPIVDELPPLVRLIRDRVAAGKKVLVHCQCGVSRSASLLIAYALYMKPHQTVQEAYDSVKNRSRWIGPNMSLIYQLSEWKTRLGKEDMGQPGYRPGMGNNAQSTTNNFGRKTRGQGSGLLPGQDGIDDMPEPLTAPLPHRPPPNSPLKVPTNNKHIPQMVRTRSDNGGMIPGISPGPSSAPPGMMTIPNPTRVIPAQPSHPPPPPPTVFAPPPPRRANNNGIPKPNILRPSASSSQLASSSSTRPPHQPSIKPSPSTERLRNIRPIRPQDVLKDSRIMGSTAAQRLGFAVEEEENALQQQQEQPSSSAFMSPRNSGYFGFGMPMHRSGGVGVMGGIIDPRSPSRPGTEKPVIRSIFDVL
ncbi:dual specificity phosphatase [Peziza echinospora]|nr:dual specificity phosphatase [Peziza echinospora]